jgi:hypothetical protein
MFSAPTVWLKAPMLKVPPEMLNVPTLGSLLLAPSTKVPAVSVVPPA